MLILGLNELTRPPWGRRALFLCYPSFSSMKSLDLSYLLVVLASLSKIQLFVLDLWELSLHN